MPCVYDLFLQFGFFTSPLGRKRPMTASSTMCLFLQESGEGDRQDVAVNTEGQQRQQGYDRATCRREGGGR